MTRLNVAVIGAGFIGGVHARSARLAGARLVAVMASSPERSVAAAQQMGAERALRSLDDLVGADDIDVVHVCTPNVVHAEHARAALEAGKHVVCEKPLGMKADEAAQLAALARQTGSVATVPLVYRFYPAVRQARALVGRGDTGAVRILHGSYLQDWLSNADDWNWRVDPAQGGPSRTMADIGSHWFDLVEFVSGHRVTRLCASLHTAIGERFENIHRTTFSGATSDGHGERHEVTTEDAATVMFETDGGAVGSVVVSQISPGRKNRLCFELDGEHSALAFDQEHPDELWIGARSGNRLFARGDEQTTPEAARLSLLPAGHPQGYHDAFALFVADTYDQILGGKPSGLPTFADGLRAATIVDAALQSSRSGSWCDVPIADNQTRSHA